MKRKPTQGPQGPPPAAEAGAEAGESKQGGSKRPRKAAGARDLGEHEVEAGKADDGEGAPTYVGYTPKPQGSAKLEELKKRLGY